MSSHRKILCQKNVALIMVKICHLSANQAMSVELEPKVSNTWMTISLSYAGRAEVFWVGCTISAPVTPSVYCVETIWHWRVLQMKAMWGLTI